MVNYFYRKIQYKVKEIEECPDYGRRGILCFLRGFYEMMMYFILIRQAK